MNNIKLNSLFLKAAPVVIWVGLILIPLSLPFGDTSHDLPRTAVYNILLSNTVFLVLFYIHTFFLYPLIQQKKVGRYFLLLSLLLVAYILYVYATFHFSELAHTISFPQKKGFERHDETKTHLTRQLITPLLIILFSYTYRIILDHEVRDRKMKERESAHLRTELDFLRSQINPHFIFNVLNGLLALHRKNSPDLEPAILNLSNLMRYMVYETRGNAVLLGKELEYLTSYVDLQKLRLGSHGKVDFHISGPLFSLTIEPMLLMPFVENAFKHGIDEDNNTDISIDASIDESSGMLRFSVINSIGNPGEPGTDTGIGLSNVQRRLSILYPDKHSLNVINNGKFFSILLVIEMT